MHNKLAGWILSSVAGGLAFAQEEPGGGWRASLAERGLTLGGGYTSDWALPMLGDGPRRDTYCSLLDLNLTLDLAVLAGWAKTSVYLDAYSLQGRDPSADLGDAQFVSNISGPDRDILGEAWVETWLLERWRVKLGKVDFNSEFAFAEYAAEFLNTTAAAPGTIYNYPTYPNPASGVTLFYHHDDTTYLGLGAFDGAAADGIQTGKKGLAGIWETSESDEWFCCAELGHSWSGQGGWGSGRAALGGWHHTAASGTEGGWATLEQQFWREQPDVADDTQGLSAFVVVGFADEDVVAFHQSVACGVTWTGLFAQRDHDALGLGLFRADLSGAGAETAVELLYKVQVTNSISLKPELQWVNNPGGMGADDALVGMLRIDVIF